MSNQDMTLKVSNIIVHRAHYVSHQLCTHEMLFVLAGGSGIHRPLGVAKKQEVKDPGAEYRSKKAKGDMKKPGKADPYAYVPLDMKNLNRRKRAKAAGQFKNLVRGAKKGASKGQKMKAKKK